MKETYGPMEATCITDRGEERERFGNKAAVAEDDVRGRLVKGEEDYVEENQQKAPRVSHDELGGLTSGKGGAYSIKALKK